MEAEFLVLEKAGEAKVLAQSVLLLISNFRNKELKITPTTMKLLGL